MISSAKTNYRQSLTDDDEDFISAIVRKSKSSFRFFFNTIFAVSMESVEGQFVRGAHLDEWCERFQNNQFTSTLSARKHSKTTTALAYVLWKAYTCGDLPGQYFEGLYLSYKGDLAAYHLKKAKDYVRANPFFNHFRDLTEAESILNYKISDKKFIVEPEGILSFKRGRHPHFVICDDILRDPEKKLDISQIEKINRIFFEQVMSLPKEGGELHLEGTAQDKNDLFFQTRKRKKFDWQKYPAIISHKDKKVLWPEMFPYERLIDIRDNDIGQKAFSKEYQCSPVRTEEAYFKEEQIDGLINEKLENLNPRKHYDIRERVFGGLDIGKKTHPSHLVAFKLMDDGKLVQICSKWMDRWDYNDQKDLCNLAMRNFGMNKMLFDNTRGEFEAFMEAGELGSEMEPVVLTGKEEDKLVSEFDKRVGKGRNPGGIELLGDERQKRQICIVDNNLKAPETEEGHGDAFWSVALAIRGAGTRIDLSKAGGVGVKRETAKQEW